MSTPISGVPEITTGTAASTTPSSLKNNQLAKEDVFLKLLVAQLKSQNPLNPMDGLSFVTQLAQFSQLETLFGIRSDLQTLVGQTAPPSSETPSTPLLPETPR